MPHAPEGERDTHAQRGAPVIPGRPGAARIVAAQVHRHPVKHRGAGRHGGPQRVPVTVPEGLLPERAAHVHLVPAVGQARLIAGLLLPAQEGVVPGRIQLAARAQETFIRPPVRKLGVPRALVAVGQQLQLRAVAQRLGVLEGGAHPAAVFPVVILCLRGVDAGREGPPDAQRLAQPQPDGLEAVVQDEGRVHRGGGEAVVQAAKHEGTGPGTERVVHGVGVTALAGGQVVLQVPRAQQRRQGRHRVFRGGLTPGAVLDGDHQAAVTDRRDVIQAVRPRRNHRGVHGVVVLRHGDTGRGRGHPVNHRRIAARTPGTHVAVGAQRRPPEAEVREQLGPGLGAPENKIPFHAADGRRQGDVVGVERVTRGVAGGVHVAGQYPAAHVQGGVKVPVGVQAVVLVAVAGLHVLVKVAVVGQAQAIHPVIPAGGVILFDQPRLGDGKVDGLGAEAEVHPGALLAGERVTLPVLIKGVLVGGGLKQHPGLLQPLRAQAQHSGLLFRHADTQHHAAGMLAVEGDVHVVMSGRVGDVVLQHGRHAGDSLQEIGVQFCRMPQRGPDTQRETGQRRHRYNFFHTQSPHPVVKTARPERNGQGKTGKSAVLPATTGRTSGSYLYVTRNAAEEM